MLRLVGRGTALSTLVPALLLVACLPGQPAAPGGTQIVTAAPLASPTSPITDTPSLAPTLEQTAEAGTSPFVTTSPVKAIAAGTADSVALLENGDVLAWGQKLVFGLAANSDVVQPLPALLPAVHKIRTIYARDVHVLFVDQTGYIHESSFLKPGESSVFSDIDHVQQVTSGNGETLLALKEDGSVWAWGAGQYGQLGTGKLGDTRTFIKVPLDHVTQILMSYTLALAVRDDGTLWAWGWSPDVTGVDEVWSSPRQVRGVQNAQSVADGNGISILHKDGTVTVWIEGILHQIQGLPPIVQVDGQYDLYNLGVGGDGTVWAWGQAWFSATYPEPMPTAGANGFERFRGHQININDIVQVSADAQLILALDKNGTVWAWGYSRSGEIGTGLVSGLIKTPTPIIIYNP